MTANLQEHPLQDGINQVGVARTLLRIVAQLPESEYSDDKSNGHNQRQVEVRQHSNLPDPASDEDTSQG